MTARLRRPRRHASPAAGGRRTSVNRRARLIHSGLTFAVVLMIVAGPRAQAEHHIVNAVIETRSAAQGLAGAVASIAARGTTAWIGYALPIGSARHDMCPGSALEPPTRFLVLARVEAGRVVKLRTLTPDCMVDAVGMPLVWLTDVKASESAAWLSTFAELPSDNRDTMRDLVRPAVTAIGLHATDGATTLIRIVRTNKNRDLRRQAMNWLGESKDPQALRFIEELLAK